MTATSSFLLLRALCDELARCGLTQACTSPGSRSTPIVLSLVRERRIRCYSHIDERCAGFFALGAAKAGGRPVAVTCTSGTAAANLHPAVAEAYEARVPLIVLTADRPAELRDVGAGQTIDQLKLYGSTVKWFCELDLGVADAARMRWVRALACRAYLTALEGRSGPVHLNIPLREPLVPEAELPEDPSPGRPDGRPWVASSATSSSDPPPLELAPRGVVIAGRDERQDGLGAETARFAERHGYPLLADPLSGARRGGAAIAHYDLLLRDDAFTGRARPDLVIRTGDLPTSKPLRNWLAGLDGVRQVSLGPDQAWQNPSGASTELILAEPASVLRSAGLSGSGADQGWLQKWTRADRAVAELIDRELGDALSEPMVARELGEWLESDATLLVASSMPVRDVELCFPIRDDGPRVLSNRGANGIDGTISAGFGVAAASAGPVVLLVGDVALAHDIGGLMAARRLGLALTIVLLNNDGGGIFHFLPVSGEDDAFEEHVATPHGLDFSRAAELFGLGHVRPRTPAELRSALSRAMAAGETTIIEVRTDREQNLALHRRVAEAALTERGHPG